MFERAKDCDQLLDTAHHLREHCTLESVNEPVGFAVLKPLTCASGVLQFSGTAGTLERTGRLSCVDKMLSNKSPPSPTPTSPITPSLTSSPGSAASVLVEVLTKRGFCEPAGWVSFCSSHGSISPKGAVVMQSFRICCPSLSLHRPKSAKV